MTIYTESLSAQVIITTVFTILVLVGVIGNTLSCIVVLANRSMRTPMNYLILNLAAADIIVVAFVAPRFILIHAFQHPDGFVGSLVCKLFTGGNFSWLGGSASVFSLVAISVERYFAIVHPYGNRGKLTMKKVKYVVLACWMLAVVFNLPLFITMQYNKEIDFCTEFWPATWMPRAYSVAWLVLFGALPIGLMAVLYCRVIRRLWIHPEKGPRVTQAAILKSRKRVTKMVIAVSGFIFGSRYCMKEVGFANGRNVGGRCNQSLHACQGLSSPLLPIIARFCRLSFIFEASVLRCY